MSTLLQGDWINIKVLHNSSCPIILLLRLVLIHCEQVTVL